jgi:SAM-dependent methyltransferase
MKEYLEANLAAWEARTPYHVRSAFYDVAGFKAGRDTLSPIELAALGDVRGKSLLHLQCHFGLDTLSWARRGAVATGIDFSPTALAEARKLAAELALPATFVESELTALPRHLEGEFDFVFTSHGAIIWLPDLVAWARVIARFLKPGGRFHIFEGHPFAYLFDEERADGELKVRYRYFDSRTANGSEATGTYADLDAPIVTKDYIWLHSLSEIVSALPGAGLVLESLAEHPFVAWPMFPGMVEAGNGFWKFPEGGPDIPLSFALTCTRPA